MPRVYLYPTTTPGEFEAEEDQTSIANDAPCDGCGRILWTDHPDRQDAQCDNCGHWFIGDMLHTLGVSDEPV